MTGVYPLYVILAFLAASFAVHVWFYKIGRRYERARVRLMIDERLDQPACHHEVRTELRALQKAIDDPDTMPMDPDIRGW